MKLKLFFIVSLLLLVGLYSQAAAVVSCEITKTNGGGFTTTIESVVDNCDGSYTIVLRIEHNGCGGPSCKTLSHYSVEADPGTYTDVSIDIREGQMTYTELELGPNLGSDPFQGFKIDGVSKIGGGKAGIFAITYTLSGGLQDQRTSAKAGQNSQIASFDVEDFEYVMNCYGTNCDDDSGLRGNVFHDVNGLTDNTVNGTGINDTNGEDLYVNLLTTAGVVIATTEVNGNGSWEFDIGAGSYKAQVSTIEGTVGNAAPAVVLAEGWVNTGENIGTASGNDGNINGLINVTVANNAYTENVNFGLQQRPVPETNTAASQENPGGSVSVAVPSNIFVAADPDGQVVSIRISAFPAFANSITINGTLYTSANFPSQGIVVPANSAGNPTQNISVDPENGVVTVSIPFFAIDNAGFESLTAGSANLPFTVTNVPGGLSGNVFHDINGLSDLTVNGDGIYNPESTQLYANLVSGGNVVAVIAVSSDGSYAFSDLANATYEVWVSTVQGSVGSSAPSLTLPASWVYTGEFVGITAGNDGLADGKLQAIVANNQITVNVNFGVEKRPVAGTATAPTQQNPGGEIFVTVPAATFVYSDPDGEVKAIKLTSFPVNATAITVNGVTYTSTNFPTAGISIPVNESGELTQIVTLDPVDGAVTVPFPFKSIDDAGFESLTNGNAYVPFTSEYIPIDNLYPATGPGTLAFEDLWPGKGDYDFNDLVLDYQFELISNTGNYVDQIKGTFTIRAFGASYENGFGFQLSSNIDPADLYVEGQHITENYLSLESNGVESAQTVPTIIVYDNAYNEMEHPGMGIGVNTDPDAPFVQPVTIEIRIYFPENTYTFAQVDIASFNPFIIVNQERGVEVHLPGYAPTALADMSKFGTWEDNSNPGTGRWYVNDKNLPWAINIIESFDYPIEKQEILWAHLKFAEWAMSGGVQFPDWYKNLSGYRNQSLIYQVPEN